MSTPAERLLAKLREFIAEELDAEERALLATLLAPGIASAHAPDVVGFGLAAWTPAALPDALTEALERGGVRVEGLGL